MTTVFEEKKISKAILRAGLPAMLGQLTTLIYNIADTFFRLPDERTGDDRGGYALHADPADRDVGGLCIRDGRKQCDRQNAGRRERR